MYFPIIDVTCRKEEEQERGNINNLNKKLNSKCTFIRCVESVAPQESRTKRSNLLTFDSSEKPFGKSWEEWTAEWWRWALSSPKDQNPITDTNGQHASINQSGPVWFLAGTFGGLLERTCEIPAGKAIFFPISCNETSFAECPNFTAEDELREFAKKDIDQVKTIMATINGERLPDSDIRRLQCASFELTLPQENVVGGSPGKTVSASDGYWVFLKPLPICRHEIHFFSSCRIGTQWIEARYHITIR